MKTTRRVLTLFLPLLSWACAPTVPPAPSVPIVPGDVSQTVAQPEAPVELDVLVANLVATGEVTSAGVGYGGTKSASYAAYEALVAEASTADLRVLLDHDSPIVRAYVGAHLARHDPGSLSNVAHTLHDGTSLDAQYGCMSAPTTVASHVANELCFVRNYSETHARQAEQLLRTEAQDPRSPSHAEARHCLSQPKPSGRLRSARVD